MRQIDAKVRLFFGVLLMFGAGGLWSMEKNKERQKFTLDELEEVIESSADSGSTEEQENAPSTAQSKIFDKLALSIHDLKTDQKKAILKLALEKLANCKVRSTGASYMREVICICAQYTGVIDSKTADVKKLKPKSADPLLRWLHRFDRDRGGRFVQCGGGRDECQNNLERLWAHLIDAICAENGGYKAELFFSDDSCCSDVLNPLHKDLNFDKVAMMFEFVHYVRDFPQKQELLCALSPATLRGLCDKFDGGSIKEGGKPYLCDGRLYNSLSEQVKACATREQIRLAFPAELTASERFLNAVSWITPIANAVTYWALGSVAKAEGTNKGLKLVGLAVLGRVISGLEKTTDVYFGRTPRLWHSWLPVNAIAAYCGYRWGGTTKRPPTKAYSFWGLCSDNGSSPFY